MKQIVPTGRIVGLDVARCVALIGMIATHVLVPVDDAGVTFVQQLAGGRASALFAVLAGVSLALMSGGALPLRGREQQAVSAGLVVRALLVAGIGMAIGGLPTGIAVILTYYGLLFLLGIPFLGLRARSLAILSAVCLLVVPPLSHLLRPHLPDPRYASPNVDMIANPWQLLTELTFTGYYPVVPWMAYLLAGMAIGRLDLSRSRAALELLVTGALMATSSWFLSNALLDRPGVMRTLAKTYDGPREADSLTELLDHGLAGVTPTGSWWWLAVRAPHSGTSFDLAHTIGSALVAISLCLLLARMAPRAMAVLFGAGAMTLTLYTAHVIMRIPEVWPGDNVEVFLRHMVFALSVGALFRLRGIRGPLETVVGRAADAAAESTRSSPVTRR
ncbi:MAG TPA: heparan-alpha-glucosaminide N-acetyltransferase domain-containing protein [Nocardioidaceae bacterium]|nr:heparan-alpha-glucosaminide N-acetyltransferase domain-containing protein [Nocardioidaceae bacterium]